MPKVLIRVLKWGGVVLGGLVGIIVVAVLAIFFIGGSRFNKTYDVQPVAITVPTGNEEAIERGRHLVTVTGLCTECHEEGLKGDVMEDDPVFGRLVASNLTAGKGGVGGSYSDTDFVRAIRHGVRPDGTPLVLMPAEYYNKYNDEDLGAIIAYIKSLPPVDNELPETMAGPLARLFVLLEPSLLPAQLIDHDASRPAAVEPGVTKEYGEYLAVVCAICHGQDLSGGPVPEEGPEAPEAPNITPAGDVARWTEEGFITAIRTGITPRGNELDNEFMPRENFGQMTDEELKAVLLYLKSVPPVANED